MGVLLGFAFFIYDWFFVRRKVSGHCWSSVSCVAEIGGRFFLTRLLQGALEYQDVKR